MFGGLGVLTIPHTGLSILAVQVAVESVLVQNQVGYGSVMLKRPKLSLIRRRSSCLTPLGIHILVVSEATTRIFLISTASGCRETGSKIPVEWAFTRPATGLVNRRLAVNRADRLERGVSEKKISRRLYGPLHGSNTNALHRKRGWNTLHRPCKGD